MVDVFEDERHWCLVMDLMQGGELFDLICKKDEPFTETEAVQIVKIVADGIHYCH